MNRYAVHQDARRSLPKTAGETTRAKGQMAPRLALLTLGVLLLGLVLTPPAHAQPVPNIEVQVIASQDSYVVNGTFAFTNFGLGVTISIGDGSGQRIRRGLIEWDLTGLPAGTVIGAQLNVSRTTVPVADFTIDYHELNASWVQTTVTFNNQPGHQVAAAGSFISTVLPPGNERPLQAFPVDLVKAWVANASANHGLIFISQSEGVGRLTGWSSTDEPSPTLHPPILELLIEPPPPVLPTGGIAGAFGVFAVGISTIVFIAAILNAALGAKELRDFFVLVVAIVAFIATWTFVLSGGLAP